MIKFVVFSFWLVYSASAICFFPVELQGIFSTQSSLSDGATHQYSQVTILPDGIPIWGVCYYKSDNYVILYDGTAGQDCFRCFNINLRSPNIVQIYTEGLDKCYMNERAAKATCPSQEDIKLQRAREIMLYKSRTFSREGTIDKIICPFSGQYHMTYNVNDGTEHQIECSGTSSSASNCPNASQLTFEFNQCKFGDSTLSFQCLGDWKSKDNYSYMALWDKNATSDGTPQYRCAMYHLEEDTGRIFMGFSIDATCTNHLHSPWDGYENIILTPKKLPSKPAPVHSFSCSFPKWAQGNWQDIEINDRSLWLKDHKEDKTYRSLCLSSNFEPIGERFAVYSQNQCGHQEFSCIWIKKRDNNVLEYKKASIQFSYFNREQMCSDDVFLGEEWVTQGRHTDSDIATCPVIGDYTGVIPDATDLCAHMASDCNNPQKMHYTISPCKNTTEIYEGRTFYGMPFVRKKQNVFILKKPSELLNPERHHKRNSACSSNGCIKVNQHYRRHSPVSARSGFASPYIFPSSTPSGRSFEESFRNDDLPFYFVVDQYGRKIPERSTSIVIVADRSYQCLGQWEESGIMYTYTYRTDVDTYECFGGVVVNSKEVFIIEAGRSCLRGLQPLYNGMKVVQQDLCPSNKSTEKPIEEVLLEKPTFPSWWPGSKKRGIKKVETDKSIWKNEDPKSFDNTSPSLHGTWMFATPTIVMLIYTILYSGW